MEEPVLKHLLKDGEDESARNNFSVVLLARKFSEKLFFVLCFCFLF